MFNLFKKKKKEINHAEVLADFKRSVNTIKTDLFLEITPKLVVYELKTIDGFIDDETIQVTIKEGSKEKGTDLRIKVNEIPEFIETLKQAAKNYKTVKGNLKVLNYKITLKYD